MTLAGVGTEALNFVSRLCRPNSASLIATRRDHLVPLRVKRDLTDFAFVTLKDRGAGSSEHIVDASHTISACGRQLVTSAVKARVEHFISVAAELLNALSSAHVPQPCRPVYTSREAIVTCEIELST